MKRTLLIMLLVLPLMATAQKRKDYKRMASQIVGCYNGSNASGLAELFSPKSPDKDKYTAERLVTLLYRSQAIRSYKYMRTREDGMVIFSVKYAKYHGPYPASHSIRAGYIGFKMNDDNKITHLRIPAQAFEPNDPNRYIAPGVR